MRKKVISSNDIAIDQDCGLDPAPTDLNGAGSSSSLTLPQSHLLLGAL